MDISNLMQMAGQLKERFAQAQADAEKVQATGEAGGGMVRVTVNGRHQVLKVEIDPKTMVPDEVALVEDLVRAATNQAMTEVQKKLQDKLGGMAQSMGIDLSSLGL